MALPLEDSAQVDGDTAGLTDRAGQIEDLLDAIRASSGPTGFARVEELVSALVALYGAGFERLLGHVEDLVPDARALESRLAEDELVASLLSLHGLHPYGSELRVRQALARLEERLSAHAARLELVAIDAEAVEVRVDADAGPELLRALADAVKRVVGQAAPEIADVRVAGLRETPAAAPALIPVERLVPRGRK